MALIDPRERKLVLRAVRRIVRAVQTDGGVVYAGEQAHRLSATYPGAGLSEAEVYCRLVRLARTMGLPLDSDWSPKEGDGGAHSPVKAPGTPAHAPVVPPRNEEGNCPAAERE